MGRECSCQRCGPARRAFAWESCARTPAASRGLATATAQQGASSPLSRSHCAAALPDASGKVAAASVSPLRSRNCRAISPYESRSSKRCIPPWTRKMSGAKLAPIMTAAPATTAPGSPVGSSGGVLIALNRSMSTFSAAEIPIRSSAARRSSYRSLTSSGATVGEGVDHLVVEKVQDEEIVLERGTERLDRLGAAVSHNLNGFLATRTAALVIPETCALRRQEWAHLRRVDSADLVYGCLCEPNFFGKRYVAEVGGRTCHRASSPKGSPQTAHQSNVASTSFRRSSIAPKFAPLRVTPNRCDHGITPWTRVRGGLGVAVASPLAASRPPPSVVRSNQVSGEEYVTYRKPVRPDGRCSTALGCLV